MGKLAEWIVEKMKRDGELFNVNEPSSLSGLFSSGFAATEGENRINITMKNTDDGEIFNGVSNVPCFDLQQRQQKFLLSCGSSPVSRMPLQSPSECSSPSSSFLFPLGFASPDNASNYMNGLCFDSKSSDASFKLNGGLLDDLGLSQSFCGFNVKEDFGGLDGLSLDRNSYGTFNSNGAFDIESFRSSYHGVVRDDGNHTFSGVLEKDCFVPMGSPFFADNQSNDIFSDSGWYGNRIDYPFERRGTRRNGCIQSRNSLFCGICFHDRSAFPQCCKMNCKAGKGVIDSLGAFQTLDPKLDMEVNDPLDRSLTLTERKKAIKRNENFLKSVNNTEDMERLWCEDGYTIQEQAFCDARKPFQSEKMNSLNEIPFQDLHGKSIKLDNCTFHGGNWQNDQKTSSYSPLSMVPGIHSLNEFQGIIYLMAQDQNGCRWLQRIFDEGTSQHIQVIFDEIIDHVVELMFKPFGNYVIQKFLEICNEEQRLQIVFMVTKEPGQLLRICSNAYGTRAVQKLIETIKTRQQISLVALALKPGFLDLVKDQNGNHVIQRCLQCLKNEDNKFIFDAAVKFCLQIATHRYGCCVMQRCLAHSTRKHREKLIAEISRNALLFSQDPFGNYVVQYIVELSSPSAAVGLLCQFKRHYVHLSTQKFGSHVVEKCLMHLEDSREQIVHELISVSRFDQLLQDPFANYVIQSALAVSKGPLRTSLVAAVRPHVILRTNPHCKRIFSRNLLKK